MCFVYNVCVSRLGVGISVFVHVHASICEFAMEYLCLYVCVCMCECVCIHFFFHFFLSWAYIFFSLFCWFYFIGLLVPCVTVCDSLLSMPLFFHRPLFPPL